jgi:nicotinamidase-related amidase
MADWPDHLDLTRSAVLVIDMQNDYCHVDGACARAGQDVGGRRTVATRIQGVIDAAHAAGRPVVFVRTTHDATNDSPSWLARTGDRPAPICVTGSWGTEYFGVAPAEGDLEVVKHRYSAFVGTDLEMILHALECTTLLIAGVTTDVCVESTMREAFMRDFHCVLLRDCTAAGTEAAYEASLAVLGMHFGWISDSAEAAARLGG